ncbi:hypothetical protein OsJ_21202 [Oryza sativa Japonica Group]|uniref:phosphoribosylglycinamide formyltransferase 1 n=1 Tax=Oryza sativa subsp. japonica TaxID=39947 RepID=B9FT22_ORYSJ|nr:hypothetical protein OsJ_21202 [Oryza sativa Japonica Group]
MLRGRERSQILSHHAADLPDMATSGAVDAPRRGGKGPPPTGGGRDSASGGRGRGNGDAGGERGEGAASPVGRGSGAAVGEVVGLPWGEGRERGEAACGVGARRGLGLGIPGHGGAEHARCSGILVVVFPNSKSEPKGLSTNELLNTLRELRVDSILLASYSKLIPVELVQAYPRSIWNIHPSLLPAFGGKGYYGLKVHKAVVASRARYSGPTVHFVDEHYDIGRTLAQRVVSMLANDILEQLATRVLHEEHQVYVECSYCLV